jgi:hypothetical protein
MRRRGEIERAVLAHQRVIAAARQQRPQMQPSRDRCPRCAATRMPSPGSRRRLSYATDRSVGQRERPSRPRIGGERDEAIDAAGYTTSGAIALRRQRERCARDVDPRLEAVDENEALARGVNKQRVVPARAIPGDGPGREPAAAVGLEPFLLEAVDHFLSQAPSPTSVEVVLVPSSRIPRTAG